MYGTIKFLKKIVNSGLKTLLVQDIVKGDRRQFEMSVDMFVYNLQQGRGG